MPDFRKLKVWHKAHALSLRIDDVAERLAAKNPELAKQLERACAAIPAAVAEGRGRSTDKDFARYVSMESARRPRARAQRAFDKGLIAEGEHRSLTEAIVEVRKMLVGLRNALNGRPRPEAPG